MKVKDSDIRMMLYSEIEGFFAYDRSTQIIDEMEICNGIVRVDVAVLNGALHGYEIKSESDNLLRLPKQAEYYNKVFDYMYFVCSDTKTEKSMRLIPDWWGVYVAYKNGENICITLDRPAHPNGEIDPLILLQFLRKEEAVEFAQQFLTSSNNKLARMSKSRLLEQLSTEVELSIIKQFVRIKLKERNGWRTRELRTQNDGSETAAPSFPYYHDCIDPNRYNAFSHIPQLVCPHN